MKFRRKLFHSFHIFHLLLLFVSRCRLYDLQLQPSFYMATIHTHSFSHTKLDMIIIFVFVFSRSASPKIHPPKNNVRSTFGVAHIFRNYNFMEYYELSSFDHSRLCISVLLLLHFSYFTFVLHRGFSISLHKRSIKCENGRARFLLQWLHTHTHTIEKNGCKNEKWRWDVRNRRMISKEPCK